MRLAIARGRRRDAAATATIFLLLFAALTSTAAAQCSDTAPSSNTTVTCSGSSTTPVVAATGSTGVTINVVAGASVSASHSTAVPFPVLSVDQDSTITNNGTLSLSGSAGSGINRGAAMLGNSNGNTLTNAGGATITTTGAFNDGMAANGSGNMLTNNGTITTAGPNAYGMSAAWGQINTGLTNNTLINTGEVSIAGSNGRAASILGSSGTINNSGTLSTTGSASNAAYLQGNNDQLINSGAIVVTGTSSNAVFSNTVSSSFTATIENLAGGQIISQSGSAIVTLNGNTTIINAGLVQSNAGTAITMGNGNDSLVLQTGSNIIGTVNGGAGSNTVTLQGTGAASNQFFNFQTLIMQGTAWTWTGSGTFTTAAVQSGTLEVDGSISASSGVTVDSGGTLSGTGTVDSTTINNGGTLSPGNVANPAATLTITGNLAFASAALYMITVSGANAGSASITGTAALGGIVQVGFASLPTAKTYDILHAAGGLGGTAFGGVTAANFTASLSYTPTDVLLNLNGAALGNTSTLGQNQRGVAGAISNFFNAGGTLPASFLNVFNLTGANLENALGQLDGEASADAERGAFELMNQFLGLMLDPFVDGRFGAGSGPIGFVGEQQANFPPDIALAYASVLKVPTAQSFGRGWTAWGSAFGASSTTNGNTVIGSNNVTASDYGFAGGMDYHLTRDTLYGFALAGGGTNWTLAQGLGTGRSDAFQAGVYGKSYWGPAYVAAALAFTNNWFTTNRTALGDGITANFAGQSYGGRLEAGYRYGVPISSVVVGVTPYAAIQTQWFHTPAYSETDLTGDGLGLTYNAVTANDTRSELGARFDDPTLLNGMPLILRARFAWAHDWVTNPTLDAAFQSLPGATFLVDGATPPANSALVSAGAELQMTARWSIAAKFDGEFASSSQTYGGSGTLRYTW
jgi:uncharacterized protein with beta-barrel porin domain